MFKVSMEELCALNLVLRFVSVSELLTAAMKGFVANDDNNTTIEQEKSDLCWKVLKTLE